MSISSLLRILWRHPKVVGAVALVSILGLVGIVVAKPPTYRASAAVVLLNPPAVPTATAARPEIPAQYQNPYVRFGDLSVVVDILVRITGSQEVVNSLKAKGLEGTFTIAANRDFYRGPIVDVAAESTSNSAAINDTKLVIKEIQDELVDLQTQQGTDPAYFIRAELVVGADRATTVFSGTLRLLIAAGGLGAILTIGSGLLADALERRRRNESDDLVDDDSVNDDEPEPRRAVGGDPLMVDDAEDPKANARARSKAQRKKSARAARAARAPDRPVAATPAPTAPRQRGNGPASSRDVTGLAPSTATESSPATTTRTLPERRKEASERRRTPRVVEPDQPPGTNGSPPEQRKRARRTSDALVPHDEEPH